MRFFVRIKHLQKLMTQNMVAMIVTLSSNFTTIRNNILQKYNSRLFANVFFHMIATNNLIHFRLLYNSTSKNISLFKLSSNMV